jgi:hypothetical protein
VADDFSVRLYGLDATKRLMRELEPDLLKEMNAEIKAALEPIAARARSLIPSSPPLSGWNKSVHAPHSRPSYSVYGRSQRNRKLEWDATQARSQIVIRQGGRRARGKETSAAWKIRSDNPAASMFELMGRGKSRVAMVRNVERRYPGTGRVLYRAFDSTGGPQITQRVVRTIKKFEQTFQRRMDSAGR